MHCILKQPSPACLLQAFLRDLPPDTQVLFAAHTDNQAAAMAAAVEAERRILEALRAMGSGPERETQMWVDLSTGPPNLCHTSTRC